MRLILLNSESKSSPEQMDTPGSFK